MISTQLEEKFHWLLMSNHTARYNTYTLDFTVTRNFKFFSAKLSRVQTTCETSTSRCWYLWETVTGQLHLVQKRFKVRIWRKKSLGKHFSLIRHFSTVLLYMYSFKQLLVQVFCDIQNNRWYTGVYKAIHGFSWVKRGIQGCTGVDKVLFMVR